MPHILRDFVSKNQSKQIISKAFSRYSIVQNLAANCQKVKSCRIPSHAPYRNAAGSVNTAIMSSIHPMTLAPRKGSLCSNTAEDILPPVQTFQGALIWRIRNPFCSKQRHRQSSDTVIGKSFRYFFIPLLYVSCDLLQKQTNTR